MKIIAAFDSFKGSLTAEEAVKAVGEGIQDVRPDAEVVCLPLADGGEGTTRALMRYGRWTVAECAAHDPLMRPVKTTYAVSDDRKTAIIETAEAAGLTLLSPEERHPTLTTTYGVGEMISDAAKHGCRRIIVGLGGSATCDAGMGMLAALGVRFLDARQRPLEPVGASLASICSIDWSGQEVLCDAEIIAACDVDNPLFGPDGAAFVFAPQKGATPDEVALLDDGLRHFAAVQDRLTNEATEAKSLGAAGGLAFGLALIGATMRSGAELMLDAASIDLHLAQADLTLTGEGSIDRQTLCGKLPFAVMSRAKAHGVPTIALAGRVADHHLLVNAGFADVLSINPPKISLEEAMRKETAVANLKRAASALLKQKSYARFTGHA